MTQTELNTSELSPEPMTQAQMEARLISLKDEMLPVEDRYFQTCAAYMRQMVGLWLDAMEVKLDDRIATWKGLLDYIPKRPLNDAERIVAMPIPPDAWKTAASPGEKAYAWNKPWLLLDYWAKPLRDLCTDETMPRTRKDFARAFAEANGTPYMEWGCVLVKRQDVEDAFYGDTGKRWLAFHHPESFRHWNMGDLLPPYMTLTLNMPMAKQFVRPRRHRGVDVDWAVLFQDGQSMKQPTFVWHNLDEVKALALCYALAVQRPGPDMLYDLPRGYMTFHELPVERLFY